MGRRKGGPGAGACRSQSFRAGVRTGAVFTSMCWSERDRGWFFQLGEEERLEADPAEAAIPRPCLPHIARMPQWEMGCGFPSLVLLFGWNFRKKIRKLRKQGISYPFCDSILPLKDILPRLPFFPFLSGIRRLLELSPWEVGTSSWPTAPKKGGKQGAGWGWGRHSW